MDLNQTWTHIHLWLLFEKFGPNSPGHLPPQAGGKKMLFGDTLWTWPNIPLQWNMISTIYRKWLRTVGEFLPTPSIFAFGDTASRTVWTLYNRQQANCGTCYVMARAYSLQQQNAGWAHAWHCHASSSVTVLHPTQHKIGHFGDVLPNQSRGLVLKNKSNTTKPNMHP